MASIREIYNKSIIKAKEKSIEEMTVKILLAEILDYESMSDLIIHFDDKMTNLSEFNMCFSRVLAGEPVQYVLGHASFLGSEYYVTKDTLIPREETEEVVSFAIQKIKEHFKSKRIAIADIGTGSGCIAIELKKSFPGASIYGSDIDMKALEVAMVNNDLQCTEVSFILGDCLKPFIEKEIKLDVIISNPPYIENEKDIDYLVYNNEPLLALLARPGYIYYEKIIMDANRVLKDNGIMIFEINYDQKDTLISLTNKYLAGYNCTVYKDMNGKDRICLIEKKK